MSRTKRRTLIAIALVAFASAAVALIAFGSLWAFGALLALGIAALSPMADGQPPVLWWRRR